MCMREAEAFDCVDELLHARTILERGTSADIQRSVYNKALEAGGSGRGAESRGRLAGHGHRRRPVAVHPSPFPKFGPEATRSVASAPQNAITTKLGAQVTRSVT